MYYNANTLEGIVNHIKSFSPNKDEAIYLAFGEETTIAYLALVEKLNEMDIHFFGGIFPSIIHGMQQYKSGCIIKKIPISHPPFLMKDISQKNYSLPDNLINLKSNIKPAGFVFLDGLTTNISSYLDYLHNQFGNTVNFIGGGAGSLSLKQQPCIISNEGIHQDAAVLCITKMNAGLGVRHGWKKIAGPFVATKTEQNTIYELNWQNAFEVYQEYIKEDSNVTITKEGFFDIAKGYPFGIFKEGEEEVVRDPLFVGDNGELICVGEVPENAVLYIMKGTNADLIGAAKSVVENATAYHSDEIDEVLVVDCISRTLFLEDEFEEELSAISDNLDTLGINAISEGVLSLGEISSYGNNYLEFFNKTLVVGLFSKPKEKDISNAE